MIKKSDKNLKINRKNFNSNIDNDFSNNQLNSNCNIHVMPSLITDADITALFNGLVGVVKRKIELEAKSEMIDININMQNLVKELKSKQAECNRLKNEIIYLKSLLEKNKNNEY